MKKLISVLALVAIMFSFTAIYASALTNGVDYFIRGDVTQNGKIDSRDYLLVKRAYFGTTQLTDAQLTAADVNQNGKLDARDYLLIKRVYFGTTKFDVETYPDELEDYIFDYTDGSIDDFVANNYESGKLTFLTTHTVWKDNQLYISVAICNGTEETVTGIKLERIKIIDDKGNVIAEASSNTDAMEAITLEPLEYMTTGYVVYESGVVYPYADLSTSYTFFNFIYN